jgi:hypothetical protein
MQVVFTDTFFKSFKRMINRQRWYWRVWDFFRYDLKQGVKNLIYFFPQVWKFRRWDYRFQLEMLKHSLVPLHKAILNGNEVDGPRLKKAAKIQRTIEILENITDDKYIDIAEAKLGYDVDTSYLFRDEPNEIKEKNRAVYDLADEIETKEWNELWRILKGQKQSQYVMYRDKVESEGGSAENAWNNWFDGSGIRGWWN